MSSTCLYGGQITSQITDGVNWVFVLKLFSDGRELMLLTVGWPTYLALKEQRYLVPKEIVELCRHVISCITWPLCKRLNVGEIGRRLEIVSFKRRKTESKTKKPLKLSLKV